MRFLKKFPSIHFQTKVTRLFANMEHFCVHFRTHLEPPKANQTLQRYLKSKSTIKALLFFRDLMRENTSLIDSYSLLFVIKACTQKSLAPEGKQIHAVVVKFGCEPIIFLQSSLVNMYSATGNLGDAHFLFDEMPNKNVVCWTALILAYVNNQKPNKALELFRQMQMANVEPDQVTVTVALTACADLGALDMGEWIHAYISQRKELNTDLCLNNALINMYAKCGDIATAKRLFHNIKKKDVTTWTSMIVGHALHGQAEAALELFAAMKGENTSRIRRKRKGGSRVNLVDPNDVTFIGVLMACSHAGMVEEGKRHFKSMIEDYGLKPRLPHFGCMVDLLCRAGELKEVYKFILGLPVQPNSVVWRTLLGACSVHGNVELAAEARRHLLESEDSLAGDDVVMSNIYASRGMWDEKVIIRDEIKQRRDPGCSSIEVGSCIYEFVNADDDHLLANEIYVVLNQLIKHMRGYSYALRTLEPSQY
ncbi:unnamed protein product [Ilex paraguariensis]|uniref:Pentatricopeptide repeat-containing protein n=1 Tax=Ilex paraguariensis TaxID=185542 RepID=A0ABC8QZI8_9AQUA